MEDEREGFEVEDDDNDTESLEDVEGESFWSAPQYGSENGVGEICGNGSGASINGRNRRVGRHVEDGGEGGGGEVRERRRKGYIVRHAVNAQRLADLGRGRSWESVSRNRARNSGEPVFQCKNPRT